MIGRLDDPPSFLGIILGDIVHNLRSALDHVTWQMVRHGRSPHLTPSQITQVQFPIHDSSIEFDNNRERRLRGVGAVQESIVKRYQPYQRGARASDHPFALLQRLSNLDKHQDIHLTFWCASKAAFTVTSRPPGCLIAGMTSLLDLNDPLEVGTPLFHVTVSGDRSLCRGMLVESSFTYQIAFEDGAWVYNTTHHIEQLVSDLIAEIDGVL